MAVSVRLHIFRSTDGDPGPDAGLAIADLDTNEIYIVLRELVQELQHRGAWVGPVPQMRLARLDSPAAHLARMGVLPTEGGDDVG